MVFPPAVVWYEKTILFNPKCKACICWGKCIKNKKDQGEQLSFTERFFDEKVDRFVGHRIGKWIIVLITVAWAAGAIAMTSQVEPLSEQEEFIDKDHELMKTFTLLEEEFPGGSSG